MSPKIVINEYGQRVREYAWDEYQDRLRLRKLWKGGEDLNGKILVIRHTWGIGDILYSTPAMHALKEQFPKVSIRYICTHPEVLENNPDIDKVYHWMDADALIQMSDDNEGKEWYWLDYDVPLKGGYDYKIHLRPKPQLNEFLVQLLTKKPEDLKGDELDFINQASHAVITRYAQIALDMYCWHAHVDPPVKTVYYYPYDSELAVARTFLKPMQDKGYRPIALIPHSSTLYKDYPHWKEVISLCSPKYFWIVLDSFGRGEVWSSPNIYNCSGVFKTRAAIALIIESDMCCSSDTGMLYPRAARGKPCTVTYGPHDPEPFLKYFPSAHGLRVPYVTTLVPGQQLCSVGCYIDSAGCKVQGEHAPCLTELEPQRVAEEITAALEK